MTTDLRALFQPQTPATVEVIGAPFTVHFRIRCAACDTTTRPAVLLSLALLRASEHTQIHLADYQPRPRRERAA